ncbi:hypothetical protein [Segetibacter koreensis]|uniref:hypothetical protein n=1 Tax=Segetibacter koreensis TaxID=398037 RepID=UPI0003659B9D|nr:hypothetical protein [Segetibacter koreensis]
MGYNSTPGHFITKRRTPFYICSMNISISSKPSRDNKKLWYYLEWERSTGQRATEIFTWVKPENQVQKNHNKESLILLETKRS